MSFRRENGGRALGAPRARQLQPRTRAPRRAPGFAPHCKAAPRTPLLTKNLQAALAPHSAAVRALLAARRCPQRAPASVGADKPPALASCPLKHLQLIRSLVP